MNREIQADNMTLAELVQDSLVALVMKSDGVDPHCIEALFERLARERPRAPRQPVAGASSRRAP
jgi:hypothetical protein